MKYGVQRKRWRAAACLFCLLFFCSGCREFLHPVPEGQSVITKEAGEAGSTSAVTKAGEAGSTSAVTEAGESSSTSAVTEAGESGSTSASTEAGKAGTEEKEIYVHVCGCVKNPGLYTFAAGTRAGEAVESAGGFNKKADVSAVNLAALLEDGMQLYVPSREEAAGSGAGADEASRKGVGAPDVSGEYFSGSGFPESTGDTEEAPVNINTAGAQELMTLSGIGESRAEAILSYREENGAFSSIDEIKNVSGIGEGIFEKIKNMITV